MAKITLHSDKDISATSVSNQFIDHYMTAANGEYVKIYLYLLRCMASSEDGFSLSDAADKFDHTEKDIQRALRYWEKMKLIRLEYDEDENLSGIRFLNSQPMGDAQPVPAIENAMQPIPAIGDAAQPIPTIGSAAQPSDATWDSARDSARDAAQPVPSRGCGREDGRDPAAGDAALPREGRQYTADELQSFQEQENVRELLFVTEHYLKRPLTPTDINMLLFWYDELGFPEELVEYVVEYCLGKGHSSLRYMNKVALSWKEAGISTVEQAKHASSSFGKMHSFVMRSLGISGRSLIPSEMACIDKWEREYGFPEEIIGEACRRTIANTHKPSVEYADRILESWHRQGVKKLSDIATLDSEHQREKKATPAYRGNVTNKFHNFPQRTYDYDKLEQQLLRSGNH